MKGGRRKWRESKGNNRTKIKQIGSEGRRDTKKGKMSRSKTEKEEKNN